MWGVGGGRGEGEGNLPLSRLLPETEGVICTTHCSWMMCVREVTVVQK